MRGCIGIPGQYIERRCEDRRENRSSRDVATGECEPNWWSRPGVDRIAAVKWVGGRKKDVGAARLVQNLAGFREFRAAESPLAATKGTRRLTDGYN